MTIDTSNYAHLRIRELIHMFISAVGVGVIINFRSWIKMGQVAVDYMLTSFLVSALAALAIIMLATVVKKKLAYRQGYLTTYVVHRWGLPASFFLMIFLNGLVPYVSPGELRYKESKRLRLGAFRYGLNYVDLAVTSIAGPLTCVLLMLLVKPVYLATNNMLIHKIIEVSAAIAVFGQVPIIGSDGWYQMHYRRWVWVITTSFVLFYFLLILATGVFSYVIAAILAIVALIIYQGHIE